MGLPAGGKGIALAALLAALLLLPFLGARHLENPDEPRDAEIGRSFADGSWSTVPRLNGQPYWSKPPLFTGSAGLLMKALGQEEWVPRAAAALHGVAAVAALALLAELLLGGGAGILAGAILLGIPYFLLRMRTCTTDVGLAAWMTLAMALLLLGERRGKVLPSWLGGLAAGGAALAKAVHGLLFPFLAVGIWRGWEREGREGWWRRLLPGFLLGAAAFAAWCLVLRAVDGPEAIDAFLFGNFAKRMTGEAHHAGGPFQYLSLLLRALPITFAAAAGCWAAVRLRDDLGRGLRLPLCWVLSMVLALSLAKGKRDLYLLPVLPGVALLAAGGVEAAARGLLPRWADALARWPVEGVALPLRVLPWFRADLRRRAVGAAVLVGVLSLGYEVLVEGPRSGKEAGVVAAREADRLAAGRPLVLFRMWQGEVGQFCFPLRRAIPVAEDSAELRAIAAGRPVVVVVEDRVEEAASRRGLLEPALRERFTLLGEFPGSDNFRVYAWDGR